MTFWLRRFRTQLCQERRASGLLEKGWQTVPWLDGRGGVMCVSCDCHVTHHVVFLPPGWVFRRECHSVLLGGNCSRTGVPAQQGDHSQVSQSGSPREGRGRKGGRKFVWEGRGGRDVNLPPPPLPRENTGNPSMPPTKGTLLSEMWASYCVYACVTFVSVTVQPPLVLSGNDPPHHRARPLCSQTGR